ncbi:MAG TPA: FkbM family methyltransferase [Myxococcota bacterium]|nr:FkbM family methyltransferase [Myxococcota bacterium]
MFPISLVLPEPPPLKIVDVGAMSVGADPYERLAEQMPCTVIGFEPLEEECRKLNAAARPGRRFLPYVIGDGSEQTFHECAVAYTSSLLEPDAALLGHFTGFAEMLRVVARRRVRTRRLDDVPEAEGADYLKLDVQGAELMVLDGAARVLQGVLAVHTEAEFLPLYRNQPLFADIDARLRAHGFVLHKLPFTGLRPFAPVPVRGDSPLVSQYVWCDAVYVRDFRAFDALAPEQLLKLAAILHENYASYDFAAHALGAFDRRTGSDLRKRYLDYALAG